MLQKIRSGPVHRSMCLEQQDLHVVSVTSREALITLQELLCLRLVILPKSIVPDIVLSQTDVDVKGDIVLCSLQ
jgi:hypothetical protein